MEPPNGVQPRLFVTIQPPGTVFDPPAAMTVPNVDGYAPGQIIEIYSFDHGLGQFVSVGTGTVSPDGSVIASDPGQGVIKAGWELAALPDAGACAFGCAECEMVQDPPCICVADQALEGQSCGGDVCKRCTGGNCQAIDLTLEITSPEAGAQLNIDDQPSMPQVNAEATITPSVDGAEFSWKLMIEHTAAGLTCRMNCSETTGASWSPAFTDCTADAPILGGEATLTAEVCEASETRTFQIRGQNPDRGVVQAEIGADDTALHIACLESQFRQFTGSGLPLEGPSNDLGVFQIVTGRTCAHMWDWRANVAQGLAILEAGRGRAAAHHTTEHIFNADIAMCDNPAFVPPPLSAVPGGDDGISEVEREAIRRFNGGREHHWRVNDFTTCAGEWIVQTTSPFTEYVNLVLGCAF